MINSFLPTLDKSPKSQNVISDNLNSLSARNLSRPTIDDINPDTAIPDKIKTMFDPNDILYANNKQAPTDIIPNVKAKILTIKLDNDSSIAKQAPTLAPDETPKISGETNLLLNILWYIDPLIAKDAPITILTKTLYNLKLTITLYERDSLSFINNTFTTSPKGNFTLPILINKKLKRIIERSNMYNKTLYFFLSFIICLSCFVHYSLDHLPYS